MDAGKRALGRESVRQQLASLDPVTHVLQQALEILIALPFDEQVERVENGQAGFDERQELLVENDELALLDLAAPPDREVSGKQGAGLDRVNQQPLLYQAVANLGLGISVLHLLENVSALVGCFD